MTELEIACEHVAGGDWTCRIVVSEGGRPMTEHRVRVGSADLARLDPGATDPHLLVDRSFRFLLARESPASILRAFDLTEIGRYFPEYEAEIRRR